MKSAARQEVKPGGYRLNIGTKVYRDEEAITTVETLMQERTDSYGRIYRGETREDTMTFKLVTPENAKPLSVPSSASARAAGLKFNGEDIDVAEVFTDEGIVTMLHEDGVIVTSDGRELIVKVNGEDVVVENAPIGLSHDQAKVTRTAMSGLADLITAVVFADEDGNVNTDPGAPMVKVNLHSEGGGERRRINTLIPQDGVMFTVGARPQPRTAKAKPKAKGSK